ncbi:hypothetical protein COCON_G00220380 [Conger conger]|uniref:EF-hand domain-containing protein n=1 Tax=Conger conger TaxID=82655 RepID=A0A9Q1HPN6_CONCO|nr:hypothetical protein COCON_G00220380 [Conger conger]
MPTNLVEVSGLLRPALGPVMKVSVYWDAAKEKCWAQEAVEKIASQKKAPEAARVLQQDAEQTSMQNEHIFLEEEELLDSKPSDKMWGSGGLRPHCVLLVSLFVWTDAVPISVDKTKITPPEEKVQEAPQSVDTGLHYDRYLREVIDFLEKDQHFREKLHNTDMEDIKQGKLAKELDFVSHHVRTKLDELKRQEVSRLRTLIKAKQDLEGGKGMAVDHQALLKQFEYLNHMNPHTFEVEDLDRLIKSATSDLENYDKERHEEFKRYEMMKEHERREHLKTLDEEGRRREEEHYEELKKKHADHPKINHPGSQDQLKEVWEEADGLDPEDFDPKTFFNLHDTNGDGFFDEQELEALFTH